MADTQELEARIIALEAVFRMTMLPLWKALTPIEGREIQIDSLAGTARNAEDYYKNRDFGQLIAGAFREWVDELSEASQAPLAPPP